jgi:hypothetical protein
MTDDNESFAFPCTGEGYGSPHYTQKGMTLRDYFAGQALAGGLIAHHGYPLQTDEVTSDAYAIADAMLAERASA